MTEPPTTRTKPNLCPYCGYMHDAATEARGEDVRPKPGDFSVCISCGSAGVFTPEMGVRKLHADELRGLPKEQVELLAQAYEHCARRGPLPSGGRA